MARRKFRSSTLSLKKAKMKWVSCLKGCGEEVLIDDNCTGAICWKCTQILAGAPDILLKKKKQEDGTKIRRPRGWKFYKEFVDSDGNVFLRGVEQPKLKGKKKPTIIVPKNKKTAFEKEQDRLKKQKKLADKYKKRNGKK